MREFSIILPLRDNDGADLGAAHRALQDDLLRVFGGYTLENVQGAWVDPETKRIFHDHSARYVVAADPDPIVEVNVQILAARACRAARQKAVYIRHQCGRVEFIEPSDFQTAAA